MAGESTPINYSDPRPAHRQIADELRRAIVSGELKPGDRLPSTRQLATGYEVTPVTANQALNVLKTEGLVEVRAGRGVFVKAQPIRRRVTRDRRVHRDDRGYYFDPEAVGWVAVTPPLISYGTAPADVAALLGLEPGALVLVRDRQMGEAGRPPLQLATSYLPADLARGTQLEQVNTGPGGIYDRFEEMGNELHWVERVTARMPTAEEAATLRIGAGVPLLRVLRVTLNQKEEPLEVNDTRMPADHFEVAYPPLYPEPR